MEIIVILLVIGLAIPLHAKLRMDFVGGLAYAVFLWVSMTTFLRIDLPGALPELTLHRLLLIVVFLNWLRTHRLAEMRTVPLAGCFGLWIFASFLSLLGTQIEFVTSLKRFLDFVLEVFVFYTVISTSLKSTDDVRRVLHAAWLGLLLVAVLAIVERYTGFNPVDRYIPGYSRDEVNMRDILSTYQHRILLGGAMAMGVPLTFLLVKLFQSSGRRLRFAWLGATLLIAACYYSFSRGPWMGMIFAIAVMGVLGSIQTRKKLAWLAVFAAVAMVLKPGVAEQLVGSAKETADSDSFKGGTFQYRIELWRVAFHEVAKSPWRLLAGYGPGAGSVMEIEWVISYRGKTQMIESWDNHYAYILLQSGLLGLLATLLLYYAALRPVWEAWRLSSPAERDIPAFFLATTLVLVFMMTNVLIFAKQLDYLFWTVVAAGLTLTRVYALPGREVLVPAEKAAWSAAPTEPGLN